MTSLRERLRRVPAPVIDAGLAVALAVANTIGIRVAAGPGARPDAVAYACGLTIAALALARRRWPLGVLLASAATLQLYVANYTSTYRAIPRSVALATAWAAGHRRWSLLVAAWFVIAPLAYALSPLSQDTRTPLTLLGMRCRMRPCSLPCWCWARQCAEAARSSWSRSGPSGCC